MIGDKGDIPDYSDQEKGSGSFFIYFLRLGCWPSGQGNWEPACFPSSINEPAPCSWPYHHYLRRRRPGRSDHRRRQPPHHFPLRPSRPANGDYRLQRRPHHHRLRRRRPAQAIMSAAVYLRHQAFLKERAPRQAAPRPRELGAGLARG